MRFLCWIEPETKSSATANRHCHGRRLFKVYYERMKLIIFHPELDSTLLTIPNAGRINSHELLSIEPTLSHYFHSAKICIKIETSNFPCTSPVDALTIPAEPNRKPICTIAITRAIPVWFNSWRLFFNCAPVVIFSAFSQTFRMVNRLIPCERDVALKVAKINHHPSPGRDERGNRANAI